MTFPYASPPGSVLALSRGRNAERTRQWLAPGDITRCARRQRLAAHLHRCGPRVVFEALLDVARGRDLDATLEDFGRLPPELYAALGADALALDEMGVIDGGRS